MRTAALLLALTAACGATPVLDLEDLECFRAQRFLEPGLAGWEPGFDPTLDEQEWRVGDRLLFGVELLAGDARRSWLIELTVEGLPDARATGQRWPHAHEMPDGRGGTTTFGSTSMLVRVKTWDEDGVVRSSSVATVPEAYLRQGLFGACHATALEHARARPRLSPVATKEIHRSFASLLSLLTIVQESPSLSPILWEVVERPSLWTLLFSRTIEVGVAPGFEDARAVLECPFLAEPVFCLPIRLRVNDSPALFGKLLVARPLPPFQLSAGILNIEATHPYDASRRFTARLLGARRGS